MSVASLRAALRLIEVEIADVEGWEDRYPGLTALYELENARFHLIRAIANTEDFNKMRGVLT